MKNEVYIKIIYLILIAFFSTSGIVYPNFTKIVIDSTLYICWGLDCEDIDLDNDTDIIVATSDSNEIYLFENTGNLNFNKQSLFITDSAVMFIKVIDIDDDKDIDIIFGSKFSGIYMLENDGAMNFKEKILSTDFCWMFKVVDLNKDGLLDIVGNNDTFERSIYWAEQDSSHNFTSHLIDGGCGSAYGIDVIDIDNDNDIDIIQGTVDGNNIYWYENDSKENFTAHTIVPDFDDAIDLICGDIDSDGNIDIIAPAQTDRKLFWIRNNGLQSFSCREIDSRIHDMWFVNVADVDNNKTLDVFTGERGSSNFIYYKNDGLGNFEKFYIDTSVSKPQDFVFRDFDKDGDLDIALISGNGPTSGDTIGQLTIYVSNLITGNYYYKNKFIKNDYLINVYYDNSSKNLLINFNLDIPRKVVMKMFDIKGNLIKNVLYDKIPLGTCKVSQNLSILPSGIYFSCFYIKNIKIFTTKIAILK